MRFDWTVPALLALLGPAWATPLVAQTAPPDPHLEGRPTAEAVRRSGEIELDGVLDEDAWSGATPVRSFTQNDPEEGRPVSEETEVHLLYDAEALYVGAVLHDRQPISTRLARRDAFLQDSDWFSISLDSYHDHLTAYRLMVNPSGVRADEVLSGNDFRGDDSWDPVWDVATAVTDSGWSVEMRIPFNQLRFSEASRQVWGVQLERTIARRQEEAVLAFTPSSERGGIQSYAHLTGIEDIRPGGALEVLPYAVGRAEYIHREAADVPFENPFRDGSEFFGEVGVDLKYRLASNLTVNATVNPDFGQVEVDPAVVNLSAFETRFDEKRPFFVEGGDIFEFGEGGGGGGGFGGGTQLLYSRRIGAPPRGDVPDVAVYDDVPDAATILAAGKLTGRTAGGWTLGLLEAVTSEEVARYVDDAGTGGEAVVAPLSNYLAARVQRNLRGGQTVLGGIATAVHRRLSELPLASELRSSAYSAGLDFRHEFAGRSWGLSGWMAGSRIAGDPDVILEAQESSARYYDRPDAEHLTLDPTRTSLAGYALNVELSKQAGLHWRGRGEFSLTSPGFEVNDLGFQRDADRMELDGNVRYEENQPGEVFREWSLEAGPGAQWNTGGEYLGTDFSLEARGELLSYWGGEVRAWRDFPGFDDRLTRGGPLTREIARNNVNFELNTDSRKPWRVEASGSYGWDAEGGSRYEGGVELELRPSEALSLSLGPEVEREEAVAQYLGTVDDPTAGATYGRRYLFAGLEQTTVSLETRVNVTFRPGLTLEVYAQPFLASAAFDGLKELEAPRTYSFLRYGEDVGTLSRAEEGWVVDPDGLGPAAPFAVEDEDFNRRSLRGNAVLRWEWRPGSTLFVVWQQIRSDEVGLDGMSFTRDARALFSARPDNVFLVKVSYWFSP